MLVGLVRVRREDFMGLLPTEESKGNLREALRVLADPV